LLRGTTSIGFALLGDRQCVPPGISVRSGVI
jgi:hypothetical protein